MKKLLVLTMSLILVLAFTACTDNGNGEPSNAAIYDGDNWCASVEEDTVTLDLKSNITTGFEWIITEDPEKIEVVSEEYISEETDEPVCGAPGTTRYVIKAIEEGEGTMKLCYCRGGEDGEVDGYYSLELEIDGDKNITNVSFVKAD